MFRIRKEFSNNALNLIKARYSKKDPQTLTSVESESEFFPRIARAIADIDLNYGKSQEDVDAFYNDILKGLDNHRFIPAGRTISAAGSNISLVPNCCVLPLEDTMESIFQTQKDAALLQQSGSGIGFCFSELRPANEITKRSKSYASGPISFLKVYHTAFNTIQQHARHGANMCTFSVEHPDIIDFITCKDKEGDIQCFNISVLITDEFMETATNPNHINYNKTWECKFNDKNYKPRIITRDKSDKIEKVEEIEITAKEILDLIVKQCHKNGEPGMLFYDAINENNPLPGLGPIKATNPCVTSDTIVSTTNGPKTVMDLFEKKFKAVVDGKSYDCLAGFYHTGIKPVYELFTEEGYHIKATEDHKIRLVEDVDLDGKRIEKWVRLKNLKSGNRIVINNTKGFQSWQGVGTFDDGKKKAIDHFDKCDINMITNTSSDFQKGLIAGLFLNHGYFKDEGINQLKMIFIVDSKQKSDFIQMVLYNFGIFSKINEFYDQNDIKTYNVIVADHYISSLCDIIGHSNRFEYKNITSLQQKSIDFFIATVKIIEYIGEQDVYDCTVEKVHRFAANGIMVKNCGEIPLHPGDICNLLAMNLGEYVYDDGLITTVDFDLMEKDLRTLVRMGDNIIDMYEVPVEIVKEQIKGNRRLGIGPMGFADFLIKLRIRYGSAECIEYIEKIMKIWKTVTVDESRKLAKERGPFINWQKSKYYFNEEEFQRNATLTTAAPTGSISRIFECSSSIEPHFMFAYQSNILETIVKTFNPLLQKELIRLNLFDNEKVIDQIIKTGSLQNIEEIPEETRNVFVGAMDITPEDHILVQAAFQRYIDNSISKTINYPEHCTLDDIKKGFILAWETKCRGFTAYRNNSRQFQVLETIDREKETKEKPKNPDLDDTMTLILKELMEIRNEMEKDRNRNTRAFRNIQKKLSNNKDDLIDLINETDEEESESYSSFSSSSSLPSCSSGSDQLNLSNEDDNQVILIAQIEEYKSDDYTHKKTLCLSCRGVNVVFQEKCKTCLDCGWSPCVG